MSSTENLSIFSDIIKSISKEVKIVIFSFVTLTIYWFVTINYFANDFYLSKEPWLIILYSIVLTLNWYIFSLFIGIINFFTVIWYNTKTDNLNEIKLSNLDSNSLIIGTGMISFVFLNLAIAASFFLKFSFDIVIYISYGLITFKLIFIDLIIYRINIYKYKKRKRLLYTDENIHNYLLFTDEIPENYDINWYV